MLKKKRVKKRRPKKKQIINIESELAVIDAKFCQAVAFDEIHPISRVSTGLSALDKAIGGGWPRGRIVEIYSPEEVGKSSLAHVTCAKVQQAFLRAKKNDRPTMSKSTIKASGRAGYVDIETKYDPHYAASVYNIIHPKWKKIGAKRVVEDNGYRFWQPDDAEESCNLVEALIELRAYDVIFGDSAAALLPSQEAKDGVGKQHFALQARIFSQHMRKVSGTVGKSNTCLIYLNQARLIQPKVGYPYWDSPGAKSFRHHAVMRLMLKKTRRLVVNDETVGHIVLAIVKKCQCGAYLGNEVELPFYYGEGFCPYTSVLEDAIGWDIIEKSGGWYKYKGKSVGQGFQALREWADKYQTTFAKIQEQVEAKENEEDGDTEKQEEESPDDIDLLF